MQAKNIHLQEEKIRIFTPEEKQRIRLFQLQQQQFELRRFLKSLKGENLEGIKNHN